MSNKEQIIGLLDMVPQYKLGYILSYVQGLTSDEEADDAFCRKMYEDYLSSGEDDKSIVSLEDCKKEWGITELFIP